MGFVLNCFVKDTTQNIKQNYLLSKINVKKLNKIILDQKKGSDKQTPIYNPKINLE